jgi:putative ABC transport system ATP-binding protein
MIQLENVSKVYSTAKGPVPALDGVSLEVAEGEYVAVRGPSGCGKSTLLTIIGTLGTPTSGRVRVAGLDVGSMNSASRARFRARQIGFVFQTFRLLPYLTVMENVMAAVAAREAAAARQRAAEILEKFQLGDRLTHRPGELSTGECQRVAIARAMINRPKLILADEPTGNLDPQSTAGVLDLLDAFHQEGGTVLLVTHEEQAASRADRTILLRNGRVADPSAV